MDDNDALKVTSFFSYIFLVCHASFSLDELRSKISIEDEDGQGCPLVFVGHGHGSLVLKQALVKLHDQSGLYKDLQSNLCGIVFYGGTNTKLTNKHDPMLMENKGWPWRFSSLTSETVEDHLLKLSKRFEATLDLKKEDHLSELSKHFEAALDLKKVNVCVVNNKKSILQVCIFYPYSN
jgi:hypothetical protein